MFLQRPGDHPLQLLGNTTLASHSTNQQLWLAYLAVIFFSADMSLAAFAFPDALISDMCPPPPAPPPRPHPPTPHPLQHVGA